MEGMSRPELPRIDVRPNPRLMNAENNPISLAFYPFEYKGSCHQTSVVLDTSICTPVRADASS